MENKNYELYMRTDFFDNIYIKKLGKFEDGKSYIIILIRLLMLASESGGVVRYVRVESTFA